MSSSESVAPNKKHIVIVGFGVSGLAAAILLARDFSYHVTVFDAQTSLEQKNEDSYPIGVNPRGLRVLEMINPQLRKDIESNPGFISGWSIRKQDSEIVFFESGVVAGTVRGKVIRLLFEEARRYDAIEIKLGHKLVDVDLQARKLTFEVVNNNNTSNSSSSNSSSSNSTMTTNVITIDVSSTRVLDCSGCWSKVRTAMTVADPTFKVEATPWKLSFRNMFTVDHVVVPPGIDPKAEQIYTTANLFASELIDGRWVFSISSDDSPEHAWLRSFDATKENAAKLKAYVYEHCPIAKTMLTDDNEYLAYFSRRMFTGQVVSVSRLNWNEQFVMLGDSAHAVFPATGEGLNSALEDVRILLELLKDKGDEKWFEEFHNIRVADVNALSYYAKYLVEELQSRGAQRNIMLATSIIAGGLKKLNLLGPTISDFCYGRLAKEQTPYKVIIDKWQAQQDSIRPFAKVITFIPNLFASE